MNCGKKTGTDRPLSDESDKVAPSPPEAILPANRMDIMEQIGIFLLLAGSAGLALSVVMIGRRRKPPRTLPPNFDFTYHKRFENNR